MWTWYPELFKSQQLDRRDKYCAGSLCRLFQVSADAEQKTLGGAQPGASDFVLAAANGVDIPYTPPVPHAGAGAPGDAFDPSDAVAAAAEAGAAAAAAQLQQQEADAVAAAAGAHEQLNGAAPAGAPAGGDPTPSPDPQHGAGGAAEATAAAAAAAATWQQTAVQLVALTSAMAGVGSNGGASAMLAYAAQLAAGQFAGGGGGLPEEVRQTQPLS